MSTLEELNRLMEEANLKEDMSKPVIQEKPCLVCKEKHSTKDCLQFLEAEDRYAFLKQHKICAYCVDHKHSFQRPCRVRKAIRCEICKKKHLTEMHGANKSIPEVCEYHMSLNLDFQEIFLADYFEIIK